MTRLLQVTTWIVSITLASFCMSAYSASKPILVLGDSLSAEYGLTHGSGWVALLQARLKKENLDIPVVNASISGETTSGGRTRLPALLEKYQPRVVVIELGANDALRGLSLTSTRDNMQAMIDSAKRNKARVLLIGMQIPPNYGMTYTQQFAGLYPAMAKQSGAALVPFMLDGVVGKPVLFQADRIHPTADAHPRILKNIWPHLKPLLHK